MARSTGRTGRSSRSTGRTFSPCTPAWSRTPTSPRRGPTWPSGSGRARPRTGPRRTPLGCRGYRRGGLVVEVPAAVGHLRVGAGHPDPRLLPVTAPLGRAGQGFLQPPQLPFRAAQEPRRPDHRPVRQDGERGQAQVDTHLRAGRSSRTCAGTTGGRTGCGPARTSPDPSAAPRSRPFASKSSSRTVPPDISQGPPAITTGLKAVTLADNLVALEHHAHVTPGGRHWQHVLAVDQGRRQRDRAAGQRLGGGVSGEGAAPGKQQ